MQKREIRPLDSHWLYLCAPQINIVYLLQAFDKWGVSAASSPPLTVVFFALLSKQHLIFFLFFMRTKLSKGTFEYCTEHKANEWKWFIRRLGNQMKCKKISLWSLNCHPKVDNCIQTWPRCSQLYTKWIHFRLGITQSTVRVIIK